MSSSWSRVYKKLRQERKKARQKHTDYNNSVRHSYLLTKKKNMDTLRD